MIVNFQNFSLGRPSLAQGGELKEIEFSPVVMNRNEFSFLRRTDRERPQIFPLFKLRGL